MGTWKAGMPAVSAHTGRNLEPDLGLQGIPTQSLIEFEGGGSMLSREVLGEMLTANELGILQPRRRPVKGPGNNRAKLQDQDARMAKWVQGFDGGPVEQGKLVRFLCQTGALSWRLEDLRRSYTDKMTVRKDGCSVEVREQQEHSGQQNIGVGGSILNNEVVTRRVISIRRKVPSLDLAKKKRRQSPVKLYDHNHNPRVLRSLVDDTVVNGIAGAGLLKAADGQQIENLRQQLRLACHRATELEDQMFQSQTGAPHRELLGELQLDRSKRAVQVPPEVYTKEGDFNQAPIVGEEAPLAIDPFKQWDRTSKHMCHQQSWGTQTKKHIKLNEAAASTTAFLRMSPEKKTASPNRACNVHCPTTHKPKKDFDFVQKPGKHIFSGPATNSKQSRSVNSSGVITTCQPPPSPSLTPTTSLRRYLSSLRPFSADSARAAWGLSEPAGCNLGKLLDPRRKGTTNGMDIEHYGPRWPVLFVMGSVTPPARHPLGIYALPVFDKTVVTILAKASGESAEKVRAMVQILPQFDFHLLQAAIRTLCCVHIARDGANISARDESVGLERREIWRSGTCERTKKEGEVPVRATGVAKLRVLGGQEDGDKPLILSEAAAQRALTSGFLRGVFGEGVLSCILVASRPVVVYDSAETEGIDASPMKQWLKAEEKRGDDQKEDEATSEVPSRTGNYTIEGKADATEEGKCTSTVVYEGKSYSTHRLLRSDTDPRRRFHGKEEGVLLSQLVHAAAAKFRIHSLAIRHRGPVTCFSLLSSRGSLDQGLGLGLSIDGSRGTGFVEDESQRGRPASADSDELGLPPLKLHRRGTKKRPRQTPLTRAGVGCASSASGDERAGGVGGGVRGQEDDFVRDGAHQPRSTPRCLRPGFKGPVTTAMLRQELETSESTTARLGIYMARKAEAWKIEVQEGGATVSAKNRVALALAGTRERSAVLKAAKERMYEAFDIMYLGIVRRSWDAWLDLTRSGRSLEASERVIRLVGAAALGLGVVGPLLRRRKRVWLFRWAGAMRAERVLEVQAAAVELQRIAQGFLGRARASKRRCDIAAAEIQRIIRGRAGRKRSARRAMFLREVRAVHTIECKYREFLWQRNAAKLLVLKRNGRAATKVQAAWRGLICGRRPANLLREARTNTLSAGMVQKLWRGIVARGKADVLLEVKIRKKASIRIQAAARGRGARNIYGPIILGERAAATLSRFWRCIIAKRWARRKRWRLCLALVLNPLIRGFLARMVCRRVHEEHRRKQRAVIMVAVATQKFFRGRKGRLKTRRKLLRKCAAVELQRVVRGRMVRRMSRIGELRQRNQAATWMAIVGVQRLWRGLKGKRKLGQMRADKIRWDAAFTIQAAYRRKRLWRRRAALVHARRAATDAASSTVATDADVAATADKRASSDSKRDRGDNDKNHQTATVTTSPDGDHSDVVTNTVQIPNELGEREAIENYEREVVGEGTIEGVGKGFDVCDADDGTAEQPYEDLGDVVFAAVQSSRRSDYNAMVPPAVLRHASVGTFVDLSQMVSNPTGLPPAFEARLEYYEAKLRYLAAQEAAHGPSAVKIQTMFRGFVARKMASAVRTEKDKLKKKQLKENRATVVIQAAARQRIARRLIAQKRASILQAARREASIISLQCVVRRFLAKCQLKKIKKAEKAKKDRLNRMAARIQARVRGMQTREVWRKFFRSRALLDRERQRKGAQQIQTLWRSKLAQTETERRKDLRDEVLLAEELERHLQKILGLAMEAERKNAYAVRLQCWWRGILAVRAKKRRRLVLKESSLAVVKGEEAKAALTLQCHWRAYKARRFYHENYATLFRDRERKKYCTECMGDYATRKCEICLDKFCEGCWARIHNKGARRFHCWEPFAIFSYGAGYQNTPHDTTDGSSCHGYYPNWNGQFEDWEGGTEWAAAAAQEGYESYDQGHQDQEVQQWYPEDGQTWHDPNQQSSASSGYAYGGATSYDGAAGAYLELMGDTALSTNVNNTENNTTAGGAADYEHNGSFDPYGEGGEQEQWAVATTPALAKVPQDWSGSSPETAEYYGYDDSTAVLTSWEGPANVSKGEGAGAAVDWGERATPGVANSSEIGGVRSTDEGESGVGTANSSGRPWSVNEFGQRVCGDWVEFWDESAQAAYFYNTATGEASWTEPATG